MRSFVLVSLAAFLLAALVAVPSPAGAGPGGPGEEKKSDLAAMAKSLAEFMKKKSLGKRDPADIAKRTEALKEGDLSWVLDRLREVPEKDRAEAGAEVLGILENRILSLRYTPAVLRLPDAWRRFADASEEARVALLADLPRLEDPEPATRFGLWAMEGAGLAVRLRALETLADLCSFGGDEKRLLPALRKGLEDPSPGVRDLALERLANLCDASALDWSLQHMGEPGEETVEVRGLKERRCPGDRAMEIVERPSKVHFGLDGEEFRALSAEEKAAVVEDFRKWRAGAGGNPIRDLNEGPFDPIPKVVSAVVDGRKESTASVRWWSEVDRAQFRLDLEDLEVVATTRLDWATHFRLTVIASGARQGSWEAYARKVRCGERHRLPRKGFGLIETSVQNLLDGRWKIWVRAYEWRGAN